MRFSQLDIREKITVFIAILGIFALIGFAVGATINILSRGAVLPDKSKKTNQVEIAKENNSNNSTQKPAENPSISENTSKENANSTEESADIIVPTNTQEDKNLDEMTFDTYAVGKDLKEGVYRLIARNDSAPAYYRVSNKNSTQDIDIYQDNIFINSTYVELKKGQYLYVSDADVKSLGEIEPYKADSGVYKEGGYKVGFDLPAGRYSVSPISDVGYVEVSNSADKNDSIIKAYIQKPLTIDLKDGQFIFISLSQMIKQ